jgi:hypothetical protein
MEHPAAVVEPVEFVHVFVANSKSKTSRFSTTHSGFAEREMTALSS